MRPNKRLTRGECIVLLLVMSSVIGSAPAWTQSPEEPAVQFHHTVTGGLSVGKLVGGDSPATSQMGFDYLYRLNPTWEFGIQLDLVYERGFGEFEAYAVVPIVAYSVTDRFPLFFGVGFEHGKSTNHNEPLVRLGGEYTIYLSKNKQFMLLPGGFLDWIDGEINASLVVALGYTF